MTKSIKTSELKIGDTVTYKDNRNFRYDIVIDEIGKTGIYCNDIFVPFKDIICKVEEVKIRKEIPVIQPAPESIKLSDLQLGDHVKFDAPFWLDDGLGFQGRVHGEGIISSRGEQDNIYINLDDSKNVHSVSKKYIVSVKKLINGEWLDIPVEKEPQKEKPDLAAKYKVGDKLRHKSSLFSITIIGIKNGCIYFKYDDNLTVWMTKDLSEYESAQTININDMPTHASGYQRNYIDKFFPNGTYFVIDSELGVKYQIVGAKYGDYRAYQGLS